MEIEYIFGACHANLRLIVVYLLPCEAGHTADRLVQQLSLVPLRCRSSVIRNFYQRHQLWQIALWLPADCAARCVGGMSRSSSWSLHKCVGPELAQDFSGNSVLHFIRIEADVRSTAL